MQVLRFHNIRNAIAQYIAASLRLNMKIEYRSE